MKEIKIVPSFIRIRDIFTTKDRHLQINMHLQISSNHVKRPSFKDILNSVKTRLLSSAITLDSKNI